jgi:hypothetical protein
MQYVRKILISTVVVSILLLGEGFSAGALACDYYASPNGGGSGLSQSSPFRISNFWSLARPGKTLCLLDGVYIDSIKPPENLNGTASARITIKALNDGKVRIDGSGVRTPVALKNNDYFILEGFDAANACCEAAVINLGSGADNNIVRRVVGWNSYPVGDPSVTNGPGNTNIFGIHRNTGNVLEDVAGFGVARKIFSGSQGGNKLTIRRAWSMWNANLRSGPKMSYTLHYKNTGATFENVIGTVDVDNVAMRGNEVRSLYGTLTMDGGDSDTWCASSKYLGSIGYVIGGQDFPSYTAYASRATDCIEYKDVVFYRDSTHSSARNIYAAVFDGGAAKTPCRVCDRRFTNVTSVGGATNYFGSDWTRTNLVTYSTVSAVNSAGANPFQASSGTGARMCFRYVNRTLTNTPLWPWPMNQRIIDAMKVAGKTPVDVTKTMEQIFGPIPSECRSGAVASSVPAPTPTASVPPSPGNLTAQ